MLSFSQNVFSEIMYPTLASPPWLFDHHSKLLKFTQNPSVPTQKTDSNRTLDDSQKSSSRHFDNSLHEKSTNPPHNHQTSLTDNTIFSSKPKTSSHPHRPSSRTLDAPTFATPAQNQNKSGELWIFKQFQFKDNLCFVT